MSTLFAMPFIIVWSAFLTFPTRLLLRSLVDDDTSWGTWFFIIASSLTCVMVGGDMFGGIIGYILGFLGAAWLIANRMGLTPAQSLGLSMILQFIHFISMLIFISSIASFVVDEADIDMSDLESTYSEELTVD